MPEEGLDTNKFKTWLQDIFGTGESSKESFHISLLNDIELKNIFQSLSKQDEEHLKNLETRIKKYKDSSFTLSTTEATETTKVIEASDNLIKAFIKVNNIKAELDQKELERTNNYQKPATEDKPDLYTIELAQDKHTINIPDKKTGELYTAVFTKDSASGIYKMTIEITGVNGKKIEKDQEAAFETMQNLVKAENHEVKLMVGTTEINLFDQQNKTVNFIDEALKSVASKSPPEASSTSDKIAKFAVLALAGFGGVTESVSGISHSGLNSDISAGLAGWSAGTALGTLVAKKLDLQDTHEKSIVTAGAVVGTVSAIAVTQKFNTGIAVDIGLGLYAASTGYAVAGETGAGVGLTAAVVAESCAYLHNVSLGGVTGLASFVKDGLDAGLKCTSLSEKTKESMSNGACLGFGAIAAVSMIAVPTAAPVIGVAGASYAAGSAIGGGISYYFNASEENQRLARMITGGFGIVAASIAIGACAAPATAILTIAGIVGAAATVGHIGAKICHNKAEWGEVIQAAGTELNAYSNVAGVTIGGGTPADEGTHTTTDGGTHTTHGAGGTTHGRRRCSIT